MSVSAGVYPPLIAGWAELCLRVSMAGTAKHTAITELSTILTSAANRLIGEVVQSRRRPLLGLLPLSHLRHY